MILTPSNDPLPTHNAKACRDVILRVRAPNLGVASFYEFEGLTLQMRLFGVVGELRWVRGAWCEYISPSRAHDAIGEPVSVENDVIPFENFKCKSSASGQT